MNQPQRPLSIHCALCVPALLLAAACKDGRPTAVGALGSEPHEHVTGAAAERALAQLGREYLVHLIVPPLVAGAKASAILHGTRLSDATPLSGVDVELLARDSAGTATHWPARELIPGHFPLEIEPRAAGHWSLSVVVRSTSGPAEEILLGDIDVHRDAHEAAHAAPPPPPADAIPFLFEQQWPAGVRFERVEERAFVERLTVPARILPRPGGEARVASPSSGRLLAPADGRWPVPGERVRAGQVLGFVEPPLVTADLVALQSLEYQQHQLRHELDLQQLEAERLLGGARVRIAAAEREHERAKRLLADGLATNQELDRARSELELARSEEHAALASLSSVQRLRNEHAEDPVVERPRPPLVAPIDGVIAGVDAVLGASVEAGRELFSLLDLTSVWAVGQVTEYELARLRRPLAATVRMPAGGLTLEPVGEAAFVASRVDETSRSAVVAFALVNPEGRLLAGAACDLELSIGPPGMASSVPASALAYEQGRPLVFAMIDGESFQKRRLTLGGRDRDRVRVLSGLAPGDVVIVHGAEEIRLAALSGGGLIAEHHH